MSNFITGSIGKVRVGSTDLNVTDWEVEPSVEPLESTHTGSEGFATNEAGVKSGTGNFKANWDSEDNPHDDPPNLNMGEKVAVRLYVGDPTDGNYFDCLSCLITSVPLTSAVKGLVTYTCNFVTDGEFTMPGQ